MRSKNVIAGLATRWNGPVINRALAAGHAQLDHFIGFPIAHIEAVRHDAGPRFQLAEQFRTESQIHPRVQIDHNHGCLAQISFEEILLNESHLLAHTGFSGVALALLYAYGVDVNSDPACAVLAGRSDYDTPVAAAEVIDRVFVSHLGGPQHHIDHL